MVKSCHILCMCGFSKHNCEALSAKKSVISTGLGHRVMESWSHGVMAQMFLLRSRFFWEDFSPSMQDCHAQVPALVVLQHSWP